MLVVCPMPVNGTLRGDDIKVALDSGDTVQHITVRGSQ